MDVWNTLGGRCKTSRVRWVSLSLLGTGHLLLGEEGGGGIGCVCGGGGGGVGGRIFLVIY